MHSVCSVDLVQDVVEDRALTGSPVRLEDGVDAALRDDGFREDDGQMLEDRRASAVVLEDFSEETSVDRHSASYGYSNALLQPIVSAAVFAPWALIDMMMTLHPSGIARGGVR